MSLLRAMLPVGLEDEFDGPAFLRRAGDLAHQAGARLETIALAGHRGAVDRGLGASVAAIHPALSPPVSVAQAAAAFAELLRAPQLASEEPVLHVLPACPAGEEAAARLAVLLDGAALGRCTGVASSGDSLCVTRAAFGGRAQAVVRCRGWAFGVILPGAAQAVDSVRATPRATVEIELRGSLPAADAMVRTAAFGEKKRLEGAAVVVSGGRGMGGAEGFAQLQGLADLLDGALGGSLPTVDAGWVPVARQVGQSGKFVAPEVYIAVGISGTPQHLAGIGAGTRIVAINNDPSAEIFRVAEIGCVADWREILPGLMRTLARG